MSDPFERPDVLAKPYALIFPNSAVDITGVALTFGDTSRLLVTWSNNICGPCLQRVNIPMYAPSHGRSRHVSPAPAASNLVPVPGQGTIDPRLLTMPQPPSELPPQEQFASSYSSYSSSFSHPFLTNVRSSGLRNLVFRRRGGVSRTEFAEPVCTWIRGC